MYSRRERMLREVEEVGDDVRYRRRSLSAGLLGGPVSGNRGLHAAYGRGERVVGGSLPEPLCPTLVSRKKSCTLVHRLPSIAAVGATTYPVMPPPSYGGPKLPHALLSQVEGR